MTLTIEESNIINLEETTNLLEIGDALHHLLYVPDDSLKVVITNKLLNYFSAKINDPNYKIKIFISTQDIMPTGFIAIQVDPEYKSYGSGKCATFGWIHAQNFESCKLLMEACEAYIRELGLKKIASENKPEEGEGTEKKKKPEPKKDEKKDEKGEEKSKEPKEPEEPKVEEVEKKEKVKKQREIIANITIQQCIKVTKMKRSSLLSKTFKSAVKEVVASCVSMPVTVEGKNPTEIQKMIDEGEFDSKFQS